MVKVVDITDKKNEEKTERNTTVDLVKRVFGDVDIIFGVGIYLIRKTSSDKKDIASFGSNNMILYNEEYFDKAKKFAEEYESMFPSEKEFELRTDYSSS